MQLGCADGVIVRWSEHDQTWVTAGDDVPPDLVALLDGDLADEPGRPAAAPSGLPFRAASLRGVMNSELHYVRSARTLVRRFMPGVVSGLVALFESLTRRTFPALRPPAGFYERPAFYFGNHQSLLADGDVVRFPADSHVWDFELELGAVVTRAWDARESGPPRASDVVGAFVVVDDFSARDLQWRDERRGAFSGVVKAKSFATGMSATVVTADEVLPGWDEVTGRVLVDDEVWCHGTTGGGQFTLDEVVAEIAADERLVPGEIISLGTLAGCCGLELDRFLGPGQTVRLELDGIGTATHHVGAVHGTAPR